MWGFAICPCLGVLRVAFIQTTGESIEWDLIDAPGIPFRSTLPFFLTSVVQLILKPANFLDPNYSSLF